MDERQAYIRRELDERFREWSTRAAFTGAAIFLLLGPLDFYAVPPHAPRFLAYRLAIAALLAGAGVFLRRPRSRATARATAFVATLCASAVLEAMILKTGGHHSPYLVGLILLAVTALGLIPAGPRFASAVAGAVFALYLGPILAWDTFHQPTFFAVETLLFAAVLATGVFINWLQVRGLAGEIGLRYDLTGSRERLEKEASRREKFATELRRSQELLSSLATASMDAIVMLDPQGIVRYWNPAAERIFGHGAAEAGGRGAFGLLADAETASGLAAEHRAWLDADGQPGSGRRVVIRGRHRDGRTFPVELTMSAVEREGQCWTCVFLRDVSEQVRIDERRRLFAAAVEAAAEAVFILDLEGRITYCNNAAAAQVGRAPAEIIGRDVRGLYLDPGILDGVIFPALRREGKWVGEFVGAEPPGVRPEIGLSASLVRDDAGKPIAVLGITKILTEQKRLEVARIRAQKLESIGVLAGGLAHDFNNLLTIILGNLDLARIHAGGSQDAVEALDHAAEAALRAGDLTRQLITFSKGGRPVKRVGDIVRTVRETATFAAAGSNVSCAFEVADGLPAVEFDEGQVRQVIHNIVQNGREAMPAGGTLRVCADAVQVREGEFPGLRPGRHLRLQFCDHGVGIDPAHLSSVFDPYFSTKEMATAKGRGLGLAVSFSIVRNHGGTMTAESSPAEGTTISVYLPEAPLGDARAAAPDAARGAPAGDVEPAAEPVPAGPGRGRVLVMDDEPLVLDMAGAVLRRLGYSPTLAGSSAEAIVQYQIALDTGRRFDAVILDLTLVGGPGGPETLARLRDIDPAVRAALSSGHLEHPVVAEWAAAGFAAFIAKPYTLKCFEEALARLL